MWWYSNTDGDVYRYLFQRLNVSQLHLIKLARVYTHCSFTPQGEHFCYSLYCWVIHTFKLSTTISSKLTKFNDQEWWADIIHPAGMGLGHPPVYTFFITAKKSTKNYLVRSQPSLVSGNRIIETIATKGCNLWPLEILNTSPHTHIVQKIRLILYVVYRYINYYCRYIYTIYIKISLLYMCIYSVYTYI